jgi:TonB family protein
VKRLLILILLSPALGYVSHQDPAPTPTDEKIYEAKEVDSSVKILSKPEASYTFAAVRQHVVGVVRLTAIFTRNGEIRNVQVVNGLPAGLTENAIAVARQIAFTPAMKNGHPVSQKLMIVYSFELFETVIHGQQFPKLFYDQRCRDYSNIAAENMVFFTSEKEAKKAGYKKSKTCP